MSIVESNRQTINLDYNSNTLNLQRIRLQPSTNFDGMRVVIVVVAVAVVGLSQLNNYSLLYVCVFVSNAI